MDMGVGGRRGWDIWRVTWKHTLPYVKEKANGNLLCELGNATCFSGTLLLY